MSTGISSDVGDLPCFTTFCLFGSYSLKIPNVYLCLLLFCNIIMTGEPMHTALEEWFQAYCFHFSVHHNYQLLE